MSASVKFYQSKLILSHKIREYSLVATLQTDYVINADDI